MINIFLFAPVTTPPLNANYVSEVLSQIQSFYAKKGRLGAPPPLVWCTPSVRKKKPHRDPCVLFWLQTCFIFARGGRATCCLVTSRSAPLVWEFRHYLPFQGLLGEKKCAISLYQEFNLWRDVFFFVFFLFCFFFFFSMCHYFVQCFTKNQPQNNKWPKSRFHGFMTKKGSSPLRVQDNA